MLGCLGISPLTITPGLVFQGRKTVGESEQHCGSVSTSFRDLGRARGSQEHCGFGPFSFRELAYF